MVSLNDTGLERNVDICLLSAAFVILSVGKESIWKTLPLAAFMSDVMAASKTLPDGALASRSKLRASEPAMNRADDKRGKSSSSGKLKNTRVVSMIVVG